jgi:colicin import membrane protein
MKAAHTAHKEACIKAAEDHWKDMHAHCDAIKAHLGGATNGEEGDGEKSASSEISKALAALTEKVNALTTEKAATEKAAAEKAAADKLAADKAAEEKATAEKAAADKLAAERIGDRNKGTDEPGTSTVEKAAALKKEREYNADLAKRAMGGNGVAGDRDALFELYDRTAKITPKKLTATV